MLIYSQPKLHRIVLATVDRHSDAAKHCESKLKFFILRGVQICQCTNSHDSARSILDTILGFDPIKLQDIQDFFESQLPRHLRGPPIGIVDEASDRKKTGTNPKSRQNWKQPASPVQTKDIRT